MSDFFPGDMVLEPHHEYALVDPMPEEPEVIETFNVWLFDGGRNTGINLHPRSTPGHMEVLVTVFLPDGRIARANHGGGGHFTDPTRPASEYIELHCAEPFKRWELKGRDAPVWMTSDAEQASATVKDTTPTTTVSFDITIRLTAPPWINGALLPESRQTMGEKVTWWFANRLASGTTPLAFRYDHLIEGEGEIRFEGRTYPLKGEGLKGHVRGVRRMPGMRGHTWAEGYSSDGRRGFGATMFLREGGGYEHSEGFLYQDERMYPARIIWLPHLSRDPASKDFCFELACDELGLVRIQGHEARAFWWQMGAWGAGTPLKYGLDPSAPTLMRQSLTQYAWDDGVVGHGLVERSG